ncbi:MAG: TetR/AcrR family transcriptional regulator [Pseudomonadaceae bacterium]|nr:TetR/AcrR family transcriptional regulator [Pseudomonadaceae bacterium]
MSAKTRESTKPMLASIKEHPGKRADSTARLRQRVLDAALTCFAAAGVEATSVADITRLANVSTGSLYHHFDSKNGIAEALYLQGLDQLNSGVLGRLNRCRSARTGVRSVVLQYAEWVSANREMAGFLYAGDVVMSDAARLERKRMYGRQIRAVFEWFARYVARGEMRHIPADTYVPLISGPIQEYTARWLSGDAQRSPAALKALFADAAWNAVKT